MGYLALFYLFFSKIEAEGNSAHKKCQN